MDEDEVVAFLRLVTSAERRPLFLHCHHGAGRTGAFTAIYRVLVQGWSREDAVREMTEGGFGFHAIWQELPTFVSNGDLDAIARAAGIEGQS